MFQITLILLNIILPHMNKTQKTIVLQFSILWFQNQVVPSKFVLKSVIISEIQFSWYDFFKLEPMNAHPYYEMQD